MLIVGSLYMIQAIGWVLRLVSTPTMLHETSKFLDNAGQNKTPEVYTQISV